MVQADFQDPSQSSARAALLTAVMCLAQVLTMLGVFAFPALLPQFAGLWDLSNSQAGWISGIYFAGYSAAVPVLTSLTDRIDSRRIYLVSCLAGMAANLGFALFSQGFWSALFFRALCGLGLAGTFIPGLKALIDRIPSQYLQRAVSFYTACFGLGMSLSFYYAGVVYARAGWQMVFYGAAACAALVIMACFNILVPKSPPRSGEGKSALLDVLDFRPVLRNRPARLYIAAYVCHMWEMFAVRSWMVAFLSFALVQGARGPGLMAPTTVMAVAGVFGMAASIGFGELAVRFGRSRVICMAMAASGLLGMGIGFTADLPYTAIVCLCMVYTIFFQGDSAAIHAGVITAAAPDRQGGTMALQSLAGFVSASLAPIAAGAVLDLSGGGNTVLSWGLTFWVMSGAAFLGIFLLWRSGRAERS